jgi:hypothetical protein
MLQDIFEKNIINYTFMALCVLGLLLRIIVNLVYKKLVSESDVERLSETKNKMLTRMKKKFAACYKLKIGVNNVDIFVDKSILKYRFCGLLLSTWDNAGGQVLFLNLLLVPITAVFGVTYGCGQSLILMAGAVGILSSAILIFVDKSMNISLKKNMLRLNLLEYLNNYCKVRLENPELVEQYRQEFNQVTEALEQTGAASALLHESKDELSRRREARLKKEEEKKLLAAKREEELKKAEEARKEEEKRKLEEKRQIAAKRREEERLKLEEEKAALEARLAEMKKKAAQKQLLNEQKQKESEESVSGTAVISDEVKPIKNISVDEEDKTPPEEQTIILSNENLLEEEKTVSEAVKAPLKEKPQKTSVKAGKSKESSLQEDKLIEDVLREFFA